MAFIPVTAPLLAFLLFLFCIFSPTQGLDLKATEEEVLKLEPLWRLRQLASISDSTHHLQRTFLSKAAMEATELLRVWMEDAGMSTWVDNIGNVHGRAEGNNSLAPALLLGSHYDTVIDAGMYDGALGIICSIAAVKALHLNGFLEKSPRPIEIIAFSDEEGVRFQSTFLGSASVAGTFSEHLLSVVDKSGTTLEAALKTMSFPGTAESISNIKYDSNSVWGYVEVHIEQGPVLEGNGLPLGIVGAIAGQTRLSVNLKGQQGHAGTVPMAMRRDPMAAAANAVVIIEHICKHPEEFLVQVLEQKKIDHFVSEGALVCTVGEIAIWPGASNVIPREVSFTVDIRAEEDSVRKSTVATITKSIQDLCLARQVLASIEIKHEAGAMLCDTELQDRLRRSSVQALQKISSSGVHGDHVLVPTLVSRAGHDALMMAHMTKHEAGAMRCDTDLQDRLRCSSLQALQKITSSGVHRNHVLVPTLVSGAGHDALMMAHMTKVGMLFVRCAGGISHSPDEHVLEDDVWAASLALKEFLANEIPTENTAV